MDSQRQTKTTAGQVGTAQSGCVCSLLPAHERTQVSRPRALRHCTSVLELGKNSTYLLLQRRELAVHLAQGEAVHLPQGLCAAGVALHQLAEAVNGGCLQRMLRENQRRTCTQVVAPCPRLFQLLEPHRDALHVMHQSAHTSAGARSACAHQSVGCLRDSISNRGLRHLRWCAVPTFRPLCP